MYKRLLPLLLLLVAGKLFSATVSGFVTREDSGEPLQYVNVSVAGTRIGAQTNKQGYYVITLSQTGSFKLDFSLVSHQRESKNFTVRNLKDEITLNAQLTKGSVELSKIVVTAEGEASLDGPVIRTGTIHRGREDIQKVVATVEADVFRAVLTLPGVMPISDFFSGLYVRGGSPDQNLILLDDIDVYNPSHLGGLFSTFNTDAVENVELIKGGYPAKYGGRLSSVLDVTNRQGNRLSGHGVGRVSLISSSATLEGPWRVGSTGGSYMASFRRTYLELVKTIYDELPDYYFYDGHAGLNWDIDSRNKLNLSGYIGQDALSYDLGSILDVDWGNSTLSARWMHLFTPQLFSSFVIAGSQFSSGSSQTAVEEGEEDETIFSSDNSIRDITAKGILNWKPSNNHEVETGFEVKFNDTALKMETSYQ
ncbi:MAG: TonB-dependent receptor, partial [Candidatus Cloacimonetes bacterium]|nr:TonB-dependent receptor [Candidatus Cloacimonadota bacterium]